MNLMENIPVVWLSVGASVFCWLVTALGAATVFFFKRENRKAMDLLTGFAAGVMIAASFWSLLAPSIEIGEQLGYIKWLFPTFGFLCGGVFIVSVSLLLCRSERLAGKTTPSQRRSFLLVFSVGLHNIPEGMCVGVAFGAIAAGIEGSTVAGALTLAVGIALQNFPEGAGVALPLLREGVGRAKAFTIGQLSGIVEPVFGVLGYFLCTAIKAVLPFCLAFSAGAMIAVVASELIPDACGTHKNLASVGCVLGFAVMMLMDVALG